MGFLTTRSCFAAAVFLSVVITPTVQCWAAPAEYQVKAAFLFNFTQFVEWPQEALPSAQAPIVIGVLGENPFGRYLEKMTRGESINGHPLRVEHYDRVQDVKTCHVLFISASESAYLRKILEGLRGRSVLTVSDMNGFVRNGGVIRFVTVDNKIRLRVNLEAARAANLIISSKLLRPAQIVGSGED